MARSTEHTPRRPSPQPATLHKVLVAWQAGRLTARQAIDLAGLEGFDDLYTAARNSGVPLRKTLLAREKRAADLATAAVRKRMTEFKAPA